MMGSDIARASPFSAMDHHVTSAISVLYADLALGMIPYSVVIDT
jgi:hypothetical protein